METEINYQQQAKDFLEKTKTSFKVEYLKYDIHFEDEKEKRNIYKITLKRGDRKYSFNFGSSINDSEIHIKNKVSQRITQSFNKEKLPLSIQDIPTPKTAKEMYFWRHQFNKHHFQLTINDEVIFPKEPTPYSVLACIQKYDVGTFQNFCDDFGSDTDSRKAEKTYKAVVNEWQNIAMLYNDKELEELREIA